MFLFYISLNFRKKNEILAKFFLFNSKKNYEDGPFPSVFCPEIASSPDRTQWPKFQKIELKNGPLPELNKYQRR